MDRKKWVYDDMNEIKKGPWKVEEDEVLKNHVKKYGPRDWSSIRSKGLLQRTGKSCRLRWVNKLRPNLKNGVKFSPDEERVVIELQREFGNKWARIATYLPGRTDNDVKNFWSSRQKRLARLLPAENNSKNDDIAQTSSAPDVSTFEAPKFSRSAEKELSFKANSCSSSTYIENPQPIKMVQLPELVNPTLFPFEQNFLQLDHFTPVDKKSYIEEHTSTFPQLQPDLQLGDPNFLDVFGQVDSTDIIQLPYVSPSGFGYESGCNKENEKPVTPESFIDDFPMDIFDQIEMLPSPSDW